MKRRISLQKLFDKGIQHLRYGGVILCSTQDGLDRYELYKVDDSEELLLCDGEIFDFGECKNGKHIVGTSEHRICLSEEEYHIAVCKEEITNEELFQAILDKLGREPEDEYGFWTNGDDILCPSESEANVIADFLQQVFSEHTIVLTGEEDANWFYVTIK